MDSIHKSLGFLVTALALVVLALPATAANDKKQYSLTMSVPSDQTTAPFTVNATIKNEGNSTISSFKLFVTGVTIVGVNPPSSGTGPFPGSSDSVTKMSPLKSGESRTFSIQVNTCGDAQWSAAVWTGAQLNGQTFDLVPANSNLTSSIACGPPLAAGDPIVVPDYLNPNCGVAGNRGYYDKDGSIPIAVPIYVTNTVPTNGLLHFRWPDFQVGGDPSATFEYVVCASGTLPENPPPPLVAWLNADGSPASTPGTPAFITGQNCLDPDVLPAPYGTLLEPVAETDTTISVDTSSPSGAHGTITHPELPFDIMIGTERMTVNQIVSENGDYDNDPNDPNEENEGEGGGTYWVVTRAVLDGDAHAAGAYSAGQIVMSTPLPYLPANTGLPYADPLHGFPVEGKFVQAQMCVAARNNLEGGGHATTFIDIGSDGHIAGP